VRNTSEARGNAVEVAATRGRNFATTLLVLLDDSHLLECLKRVSDVATGGGVVTARNAAVARTSAQVQSQALHTLATARIQTTRERG
jgi:hypothetical protein